MTYRRTTATVLTALFGLLAIVFAGPASAATNPPPVALTVSSPAEALPARPGTVLRTWLRVSNSSGTPVHVTITPAGVDLGNNGATRLTPQVDPRFNGRIRLDPTQTTVGADGFTEVSVAVDVPADLPPDTYVLGFLVTPTVTGGSIQVVNQVGALIALDLPGARDRRLSAAFLDAPWLAVTSHPSLTVRARNIGRASLEFTSDTTVDRLVVPGRETLRRPPALLPAGRYRDVPVAWQPTLGFGIYRVQSRLVYHLTPNQTAEQALTRTVVVLSPAAAAVLVGLALTSLAAALLLHRGRRRRLATRTGRHARHALAARHTGAS